MENTMQHATVDYYTSNYDSTSEDASKKVFFNLGARFVDEEDDDKMYEFHVRMIIHGPISSAEELQQFEDKCKNDLIEPWMKLNDSKNNSEKEIMSS